jgi:hypothetical protein
MVFKTANLHLSTALAGVATIYDKLTKEMEDIVQHCQKTLVLVQKENHKIPKHSITGQSYRSILYPSVAGFQG